MIESQKVTALHTYYNVTSTPSSFLNIPGLKDLKGQAFNFEDENEAIKAAVNNLSLQLQSMGIVIATKITDITVTANIEKIQPAVKLDRVARPAIPTLTPPSELNPPTQTPIPTPTYPPAQTPSPTPTITPPTTPPITPPKTPPEPPVTPPEPPSPGFSGSGEIVTLPGKEIDMHLGGNVWEDMPSVKLGEYTGKKQNGSLSMAGIQVELFDANTRQRLFATTTDKDGQYGFRRLNPMHKYYVVFTYDGMRYESTVYRDNLSGGYSTARETTRDNFNSKFAHINSSPNNYQGNKKAYRTIF